MPRKPHRERRFARHRLPKVDRRQPFRLLAARGNRSLRIDLDPCTCLHVAHEDRLTLRCTGERSQTAPKGSVRSDSDREGDRRFHCRIIGGNRRCQRLCIRVRLYVQPEPPALSISIVIELWKSLAHAPRHEAENLRVPVQPGRPNHRPPRTIWLCYNGILGDVDPFAIDLNAIVTVM
jgi:hypothetical protein